jgi:hypothetical protein
MSMAEIIDELPKLTHQERRELCRKIVEIESQGEDIDLCDQAAREGFAMLDQIEAQTSPRIQTTLNGTRGNYCPPRLHQ